VEQVCHQGTCSMYGVFQILKPNAFMNQLEMFKFACPWKGILWNPDSQVGILLRWWILNWLPSIPCFGHALELHHYLLWIISIVFIWKTEFAWKKKLKLFKVVIRLVTCLNTIHFYNRFRCICSPQHHIFFSLYWCVGWCPENWVLLWIVMSPCSDEHVNMES
jgi:hypothetical protein